MGSKNTPARSKKDAVIIREPIGMRTEGGKARPDRIAELCQISFHVKLNESPLVHKDVPVSLKKQDKLYDITVMDSIVGKLSSKQSQMIDTCVLLGVRYAGKIVKEPKGVYARFTRIVR